MDTRVAAVALFAITVPLVALLFLTPVAGRIARSCRDALTVVMIVLSIGLYTWFRKRDWI